MPALCLQRTQTQGRGTRGALLRSLPRGGDRRSKSPPCVCKGRRHKGGAPAVFLPVPVLTQPFLATPLLARVLTVG